MAQMLIKKDGKNFYKIEKKDGTFADGKCSHLYPSRVDKMIEASLLKLYANGTDKIKWDVALTGKDAHSIIKTLALPLLDGNNSRCTSLLVEEKDSMNTRLYLPDDGRLITFTGDIMEKLFGVANGDVSVKFSNSHNLDEGLKITFSYTAATSEGDRRHILAYMEMADHFRGLGIYVVDYPEYAITMSPNDDIRKAFGPWRESVSIFIPSVAAIEKRKAAKE